MVDLSDKSDAKLLTDEIRLIGCGVLRLLTLTSGTNPGDTWILSWWILSRFLAIRLWLSRRNFTILSFCIRSIGCRRRLSILWRRINLGFRWWGDDLDLVLEANLTLDPAQQILLLEGPDPAEKIVAGGGPDFHVVENIELQHVPKHVRCFVRVELQSLVPGRVEVADHGLCFPPLSVEIEDYVRAGGSVAVLGHEVPGINYFDYKLTKPLFFANPH
ncbi:elongation factor P [Striga asiatica]|uniref:Elongation factor P n=1 Tax=Striga asiatica TaxID=4170 RepID=A0A5A7P331_STRAF|nr:elongation factor P [Striga asiatica]